MHFARSWFFLFFVLLGFHPVGAEPLDLSNLEAWSSSDFSEAVDSSKAFDGNVNTRWASKAGEQQWIAIDLGTDMRLNHLTINWEFANATDYTIRLRTDEQGPSSIPAEYHLIATANNVPAVAHSSFTNNDHQFDFLTGTTKSIARLGGILGIQTFAPHGRYLMIAISSNRHNCCNLSSIWEVTVDATPETMPPILLGRPHISEFMASNDSTLRDEDFDYSDWIEIQNTTDQPLNLAGWHLTDDATNLTQWTFPDLLLAPQEHHLIFASKKDRRIAGSELHTNFSLKKEGEYLALVHPNGTTIAVDFGSNYPEQFIDTAYGTLGQSQEHDYLTQPTPRSHNLGPPGLPLPAPLFPKESGLVFGVELLEVDFAPNTPETAEIRYTVDGSTPTKDSLLYLEPFLIFQTLHLKVRVFDSENRFPPSEVVTRNFAMIDSSLANFSSNLPIVVLDSLGTNVDNLGTRGDRTPVFSMFLDLDPETSRSTILGTPNYFGNGGLRVRGFSSSNFVKKQYSFETWNSHQQGAPVSLFGLPEESDWILHAPYSDKSLIRNHLAYQSFAEMGHYSVRTRYFELFYNPNGGPISMDDYRGIYMLVERIKRDEERVDLSKLEPGDTTEPTISGGYIIQKDRLDPGDTPFTTREDNIPLLILEPKTPNRSQVDYLENYLNDFETALNGPDFAHPTNGYAAYIDVPSWIDQHLLIEAFKNIDGFHRSTYYTKDRHGLLKAGPAWDYNLAFGNAYYLNGQYPTGWYSDEIAPPSHPPDRYPWYPRLFEDPTFELRYWDRYFALRKNTWSLEEFFSEIDQTAALLSLEATAREFDRWPRLGRYIWPNADGATSRTTYHSEVDWLKNWISDRLSWIDAQFPAPPVYTGPGGNVTEGGRVSSGDQLTISSPTQPAAAIYYTTDGSDPYDDPSPEHLYTTPLALTSSVRIKSRTRDAQGNWGALQEARFIVDTSPPTPATLAISEINYRPAKTSMNEEEEGFQRNDFEFLELMNTGISSIDLTGVHFSEGISFHFDNGEFAALTLAPGQRILIVKNRIAFLMRHTPPEGTIIAGEYSENLSNEGETITLSAADGAPLITFTYNNVAPWSSSAHSDGYSLVLTDPETPDSFLSWRSSVQTGGTPGGSDHTSFVGDPHGDDNHNGVSNFADYALASTPIALTADEDGGFTLTYTQNLAADDALLIPEISSDLHTWLPLTDTFNLVSRVNQQNGTALWTYRSPPNQGLDDQQFIRVLVRSR